MAEMMENNYAHRQMDDGRYAYKGVGNAGLATGIIGTALGVLNGGLGLMGGMNNGWNGFNRNGCGYGYAPYAESVCVDRPVGRETFELQQRVSQLESEKALIMSEQHTEVKIADVYARNAKATLDLERAENQRWTDQLVWNAHQEARIAVLERDVSQLYGMTGLYVEASRVTPLPMQRYNFWQAPTEPAAATVAAA